MATSSNSFSKDSSIRTESIRCPKCNGVMAQGFIIDWQGKQFSRVCNWVEGAPGKPSWFGQIVPAPA